MKYAGLLLLGAATAVTDGASVAWWSGPVCLAV
jgi:hypothetical protein